MCVICGERILLAVDVKPDKFILGSITPFHRGIGTGIVMMCLITGTNFVMVSVPLGIGIASESAGANFVTVIDAVGTTMLVTTVGLKTAIAVASDRDQLGFSATIE